MQRLEERTATSSLRTRRRPFADGRHWLAPTCVVLALGAASTLISMVFWPGSLDADAVGEMQEATTGHFTDWHAPVLEAIWRIAILAGLRGTGWVLLIGLFTLLIGFYLILRVRFPRWLSVMVSILCLIFPPVLTWAVHVGADTWFAAAIITAFGFAARSARTTGLSRVASVVAAIWFAGIAQAARHNAVPAVLALFITLAALSTPARARRKKTVVCAIGIMATLSLLLVVAGVQWATRTRSTNPVQATYIYDLAQLSKEEHRVLFPTSLDPSQNYAALYQDTTVYNTNLLIFTKSATVKFFLNRHQFDQLQKAWESAVLHHPVGYLRERGRLGLWMLSIGHPSYWLFNVPLPHYPPKFLTANKDGYQYLTYLAQGYQHEYGDFLYDGWIYALLLVVAAIELWRRTRCDRVIAGLAVGMLLYEVVLEFTGPGELYRYVYPMVAAGTVIFPVLLVDLISTTRSWRTKQRGTRGSPSSTPLARTDLNEPLLESDCS